MELPVREVLPELLGALDRQPTAVLVAPPGTGKTTLVPLALRESVDGRIVVAEPRRVAAARVDTAGTDQAMKRVTVKLLRLSLAGGVEQ